MAVVDCTLFLDFGREGLWLEDAADSASRDVEIAGGGVVRVVRTPA
jgi:hypothetical protein